MEKADAPLEKADAPLEEADFEQPPLKGTQKALRECHVPKRRAMGPTLWSEGELLLAALSLENLFP